MADLNSAFKQIRSDDTLAKQFTQDPAGVMSQLGVDTSDLKVTKTEQVGAASAADISGCVSIGCIVCASIG